MDYNFTPVSHNEKVYTRYPIKSNIRYFELWYDFVKQLKAKYFVNLIKLNMVPKNDPFPVRFLEF